MNVGRLRLSGLNGYDWSSQGSSSSYEKAYALGFLASEVYPSDSVGCWVSLPLRCLARQ